MRGVQAEEVIDADQIATAIWRIFLVEVNCGIRVRNLIGEVHYVSRTEYRVSRATYPRSYTAGPPLLVLMPAFYKSLEKACEALL